MVKEQFKLQGTSLDRRRKLSESDKELIREIRRTQGLSYDKIALMFNVSKRLISFVCQPKQLEKCKEQFKERCKDGRYYNTEKNTIRNKATREYRKKLINLMES